MTQTRYEADRRLLQQMLNGNEQVFPQLREIGFPENGQWQACWIAQAWNMPEGMETKEALKNLFVCQPDLSGEILCVRTDREG